MTYRVILTGSRSWNDDLTIEHALTTALEHFGRDLVLVHGACPLGADAIAGRIATELGIPQEPHPADWDRCAPECPSLDPYHRRTRGRGDEAHPGTLPDYCPKAGPRRNREMVALGADFGLVFMHGVSYGTAHCWRLIREAGIAHRRWSA